MLAGEVCDGLVSKVLHPSAERFGTLDAAGGVRIERRVRRLDVGLAYEVLCNGALGLLDSMQFLEPPLGLLEVDHRPEEIA